MFVGYGIVAPEFRLGRLQGRGPQGQGPPDDEQRPGGRPRAVRAARRASTTAAGTTSTSRRRGMGAAGAIIIHTTPSAGYAWQVVQSSWTGEQFALPHEGGPHAAGEGLGHRGRGAQDRAPGRPGPRRAARGGPEEGLPAGAAGRRAERRPCSNDVQKKQTANVIGRLPGRDPALSARGRDLHRPPRPPGPEGGRQAGRGRHLQRRLRQRLRRRRAAGHRPGHRPRCPSAPRRSRALRGGGRRGAGAAGLEVPRRPSRRAARAAWPPTSTWTASTSGAAPGTSP